MGPLIEIKVSISLFLRDKNILLRQSLAEASRKLPRTMISAAESSGIYLHVHASLSLLFFSISLSLSLSLSEATLTVYFLT